MCHVVRVWTPARHVIPELLRCGGIRDYCHRNFIGVIKGVILMKVVLIERPKFWSFILRRMYKIPKLKNEFN